MMGEVGGSKITLKVVAHMGKPLGSSRTRQVDVKGGIDNLLSFLFLLSLIVAGQRDKLLLLIARSLSTCADHCDDELFESVVLG